MARPYGEKFLRSLNATEETGAGIELAKLCVAANLPATHVAIALGTTRLTIYCWYRGQDIRKKKRKIVESFLETLRQDLASGVLPVKDVQGSKEYLTGLIGTKL